MIKYLAAVTKCMLKEPVETPTGKGSLARVFNCGGLGWLNKVITDKLKNHNYMYCQKSVHLPIDRQT